MRKSRRFHFRFFLRLSLSPASVSVAFSAFVLSTLSSPSPSSSSSFPQSLYRSILLPSCSQFRLSIFIIHLLFPLRRFSSVCWRIYFFRFPQILFFSSCFGFFRLPFSLFLDLKKNFFFSLLLFSSSLNFFLFLGYNFYFIFFNFL